MNKNRRPNARCCICGKEKIALWVEGWTLIFYAKRAWHICPDELIQDPHASKAEHARAWEDVLKQIAEMSKHE